MDNDNRKRSNRTALAIACAAAIPALGTLFVASAEGQHRNDAQATTVMQQAAATAQPQALPAEAPQAAPPGTQPVMLPRPAEAGDPLAADPAKQFELPLKPGEFEWHPEASLAGDVVILVSLPTQELHVYRGGVRIARSSISTGKAGHDTPVGAFPILQKRKVHHSSLYDDAPMPFMQRLTWGGIALHAGRNPGYPASHGCIRLPMEFAEKLFDVTDHGEVVVVADYTMFGNDVLSPGPVASPKLLSVARSALEPDEHAEDVASAGI
jgi:lipoprotein-anchoring transpeptidase ErfK/SrfK